jgi:hypothetical protein
MDHRVSALRAGPVMTGESSTAKIPTPQTAVPSTMPQVSFARDLTRKPVATFRDHALSAYPGEVDTGSPTRICANE